MTETKDSRPKRPSDEGAHKRPDPPDGTRRDPEVRPVVRPPGHPPKR